MAGFLELVDPVVFVCPFSLFFATADDFALHLWGRMKGTSHELCYISSEAFFLCWLHLLRFSKAHTHSHEDATQDKDRNSGYMLAELRFFCEIGCNRDKISETLVSIFCCCKITWHKLLKLLHGFAGSCTQHLSRSFQTFTTLLTWGFYFLTKFVLQYPRSRHVWYGSILTKSAMRTQAHSVQLNVVCLHKATIVDSSINWLQPMKMFSHMRQGSSCFLKF